VQLQAFARLKEGPRHPAGREAEQATTVGKGGLDERTDLGLNRFQGSDRTHQNDERGWTRVRIG